ncbi:hypothetical protein WA026_006142 [Henosepilachna vigintioctopunctata]|uniref:Uncharacterized protein n=1 Tax=Henosepilachna vigintioctopunctata TaxID=420089 RepID=A0AAW1TPQ8_9CUCU
MKVKSGRNFVITLLQIRLISEKWKKFCDGSSSDTRLISEKWKKFCDGSSSDTRLISEKWKKFCDGSSSDTRLISTNLIKKISDPEIFFVCIIRVKLKTDKATMG